MNFIEDFVERFPAARPALIEVAADGSRRMHHFGELFARSAGLSGAFALPCSPQLRRKDLALRAAAADPALAVGEERCLAERPDDIPQGRGTGAVALSPRGPQPAQAAPGRNS